MATIQATKSYNTTHTEKYPKKKTKNKTESCIIICSSLRCSPKVIYAICTMTYPIVNITQQILYFTMCCVIYKDKDTTNTTNVYNFYTNTIICGYYITIYGYKRTIILGLLQKQREISPKALFGVRYRLYIICNGKMC